MTGGDASAAETPELLPRELSPEGTLAGDYLQGREGALELFPPGARVPGEVGEDRTPRASVTGADARLEADDLEVSSPEARRRLERILEGEGVLVTTGQQPVLFLGPLYVLYKALTALETARRLEEAGTPALALFWVASDDHDWPEVGRTRILDTGNELRTLELEAPPGREGRSVGPTALPGEVEGLVDDMAELLPSSEFVSACLESIRDAYHPGATVGGAFADLLRAVLAGRDFALLDSASAAVREAALPLVTEVLADAPSVEGALAEGARRVGESGYEPQAPHQEGGLPLFLDREEGRTRLFLAGGERVRLGRDGGTASREELRALARREPGRFSPNVALRPVLESWLLPAARTVVGPSEIAYWAQLPPLFGWAGVPMPAVAPRLGWTVLESKVGKVLEKLDVAPAALEDGGDALVERITEEGRPRGVEEALRRARSRVGEALEDVEEAVAQDLPGIRSAVGAARHEVFAALSGLGGAVDDRVRERRRVLVRQVRKAAVHLHPRGEPQERVQSPFYYLSRYGPAFVEALAEASRRRLGG